MRCRKTDMKNSHLQPVPSLHTLRPFAVARAQSKRICGNTRVQAAQTVRLLQFWSETTAGATFYSRGGRSRGGTDTPPDKTPQWQLINRSSQSERSWLKPSPVRARTPPSSPSNVDDSRDATHWEWIKRCCKRLEICSLQGNKMTAFLNGKGGLICPFGCAWHVFKWEFIHKCASRASPCVQEQRGLLSFF